MPLCTDGRKTIFTRSNDQIKIKRVLKMRGTMPSANSVLFLMGAVVMRKVFMSYIFQVTAFRAVKK